MIFSVHLISTKSLFSIEVLISSSSLVKISMPIISNAVFVLFQESILRA